MYGTDLALLGWAAYAVAREHRIAQLRRAVRNKLASRDGETGVVQVAPVCAQRLLQGTMCPLAQDAWKRAYLVVGEVKRVRSSKLLYDLRGGVA